MIRFEWDARKNELNRAKHGIDFEIAQLVFDDPFCLTLIEQVTAGEERWHAIGSVDGLIVLVVVHTYREEGSNELIRLISARRASARERSCMSKLTAEKRKELAELAALPDDRIDFSDIPEIRELPPDTVVGKFYRPKKTSVTIRLDADVVARLKASGEGYQTRINAYLRQLMRQKQSR